VLAGRISPSLRFHFTNYPEETGHSEESGHKQRERDLKFFLEFFLDRQVQTVKTLLSTSPTFDVDRSGLI
jgi:hypothetical protein